MRKPVKQATVNEGGIVPPQPSEPNLPDLTQPPYPTMLAIWKAQGQALCGVCGYQMTEQGACVWDPSHKETK